MTDEHEIYQETENGFLVVRGAQITHYLGSSEDVDRYVLELPTGTFHQTGPYTMRRESK